MDLYRTSASSIMNVQFTFSKSSAHTYATHNSAVAQHGFIKAECVHNNSFDVAVSKKPKNTVLPSWLLDAFAKQGNTSEANMQKLQCLSRVVSNKCIIL